eukprot:COSAG02_NODE_3913_length_6051_cov_4.275874_5_plen_153_part_00
MPELKDRISTSESNNDCLQKEEETREEFFIQTAAVGKIHEDIQMMGVEEEILEEIQTQEEMQIEEIPEEILIQEKIQKEKEGEEAERNVDTLSPSMTQAPGAVQVVPFLIHHFEALDAGQGKQLQSVKDGIEKEELRDEQDERTHQAFHTGW